MSAPEHVGSIVAMGHLLVAVGGLSCPVACGILVPLPEIEPLPHAWDGRVFTTGPPGKSLIH